MASLIPTGGIQGNMSILFNRRPNPALFYPSYVAGGSFGCAAVIQRRPAPTVRQFSGTVDPETTASVELVNRASGAPLEKTSVNPSTGEFSFRGWYDPDSIEYGFRFLAPDGFVSQTFPVAGPEWNAFYGRPDRINSAQGSRP